MLLDLLYGELDELTQASAKRHHRALHALPRHRHGAPRDARGRELAAGRSSGRARAQDPGGRAASASGAAVASALRAGDLGARGLRDAPSARDGGAPLADDWLEPGLSCAPAPAIAKGCSSRSAASRRARARPWSYRCRSACATSRSPAAAVAPAPEAAEKSLRAQASAASPTLGASGDDELAKGDGVDTTSAFANGVALFDEGRYVEARRAFESVATRGGERARKQRSMRRARRGRARAAAQRRCSSSR